jgi:hypothetical protein
VLNKVYDKSFPEVPVNNSENVAAEYAKEIRDKKVFYDLCKNYVAPSVSATGESNPLLKFFTECQQSHVVALPILFKIRDGKLKLENYTICQGVCESFAKAIVVFPN